MKIYWIGFLFLLPVFSAHAAAVLTMKGRIYSVLKDEIVLSTKGRLYTIRKSDLSAGSLEKVEKANNREVELVVSYSSVTSVKSVAAAKR